MYKKLFFLCLSMVLTTSLWAQGNNKAHARENSGQGIYNTLSPAKDINFAASNIQFWCGNGSNEAVVIVAWDDITDTTALAWGVRWNGSDAVALDMLDSIAAYDSRFTFSYSGSMLSDVEYADSTTSLVSPTNWWCYYKNGSFASSAYGNEPVDDGDVLELSANCMFGMTSAVAATNPGAVPDTTGAPTLPDTNVIDAAQILNWAGSGNSQCIIAVNWADTCLAWGVRFNDSILLQAAMDTIACADYRFRPVTGIWGLGDIYFRDYLGISMALTTTESGYNYWWCNLNGRAAQVSYDQQMLVDGDFVKWGDASIGIAVDSAYGYPSELAFNDPIVPIDVRTSGPFCGAAETEGSTAVKFDDSRILGWATSCTLNLGPSNIADTNANVVSYGSADQAVGPVTGDNLAVVSLGDGGSATLTFEHPIRNGEGYDFAVFENSFNDSFLELAFVEVSTDGQRYVRFPATSLTSPCQLLGAYGSVDPTYIDGLAGKYRSGYGTPYDLALLADSTGINLDSIMYVRIVDVVGTNDPLYATYDQYGNAVMDPYPTDSYSSGFDLDGIAVMNWNYTAPQGINSAVAGSLRLFPNPANNQVTYTVEGDGIHLLSLYNITGECLLQRTFVGRQSCLNISDIASGVYILRIDDKTQRLIIRH